MNALPICRFATSALLPQPCPVAPGSIRMYQRADPASHGAKVSRGSAAEPCSLARGDTVIPHCHRLSTCHWPAFLRDLQVPGISQRWTSASRASPSSGCEAIRFRRMRAATVSSLFSLDSAAAGRSHSSTTRSCSCPRARRVLGRPRRCKPARAFRWEHSDRRLKLAQLNWANPSCSHVAAAQAGAREARRGSWRSNLRPGQGSP
jgi:hypothetical protein